jgi:NO-binding membrane sensor protein with MHYT domain/two-component sensor histidine kinase
MFDHNHHLQFMVLSLAVAVLGSWTALDLFRRTRAHIGRLRQLWLAAAAVAMGLSIWSMHFIAMLGFDPGAPVAYDPGLTILSLLLAVIATGGAFMAAAREHARFRRLVVAGSAMGVGICTMHYVGMAALKSDVSLGYDGRFVVASFVIAVVASTAALLAASRERSAGWRAWAALILGFAIAGMHYTAMAGLTLTPLSGVAAGYPDAPPLVLGASVAAGTLALLLTALMASLHDQRLNVLAALDAGQVGYWEAAMPNGPLHMSGQAKLILGRSPDEPIAHAELIQMLSPEDVARRERLLAQATTGGGVYDAEYRLQSGPAAGRWVNVRAHITVAKDGRPRRMIGVVMDVTDRREAFTALAASERRQRLLVDELNHRVKNTLATVQSIARQTAKGAGSTDAFSAAFDARVMALSQTHNALTRGGWEGASLRELLEQEFEPYGPARSQLEGEDLILPPRQTLALGMVFHELATNAAKHGALSAENGQVAVSWSLEDERLALTWTERGGPAPAPSERRGFGSRLLKVSIERELGGAVTVDSSPQGLRCEIVVPCAPCIPGTIDLQPTDDDDDRSGFG